MKSNMETEYKNAVGKGAGEVMRDLAEFLSTPFVIRYKEQTLDLCALLPDLNMHEQLTFALMSEALTQGWDPAHAEGFVRNALSSVADPVATEAIFAAFREPHGKSYAEYSRKYGNRFSSNVIINVSPCVV